MTEEKTKATRLEEIEYNGQKAWRYSDGSIRDDGGRLLAQPPFAGNNLVTREDSLALHERRKEKKHEAVIEAANLAVQLDAKNSDIPAIRALQDDPDAWIKAIAMARTSAAMDKDNPYGAKSAEWMINNSGLAESQIEPQAVNGLVESVLKMLDRLDREIVDGKVIE